MIALSARKVKFAFMIAGLALALGLLTVACGGGDDDDDAGDNTPAATTAAASETPADDGDNGDGGDVTVDITMGDNFFELDGEKNPDIEVAAGANVTINLENKGTAIHNMRFAGEDGKYSNADDAASDPALVAAGGTATLEFTAPEKAGTYTYQCDFHTTDMLGKITVE